MLLPESYRFLPYLLEVYSLPDNQRNYLLLFLLQNQYAILQLRQLCAIADCQVENQELKLSLNQENYVVHFDRNRLVKESGYEILMEGIDDAYFEEQKGSIYLVYAYKTEKYHFEIA